MLDPKQAAVLVLNSIPELDIPAMSLGVIAKQQEIPFKFASYPDDQWDGALLFKGTRRVILVNTYRGQLGRHNFTFAHELGHHFLMHKPDAGQDKIQCSSKDMQMDAKQREREANQFAVELLMPELSFQLSMSGSPIDFSLIGSLAKKFMVSKHAASNRILDLSPAPCIIITSTGVQIETIKASRAARSYLAQMKQVPKGSIAAEVISNGKRQDGFLECDPQKWFVRRLASSKLYSCTHGGNNHYMTILHW